MLNIKTPFYTAGKMFKWDYAPIGLGINKQLLADEGILQLTVGNDKTVYEIDKAHARDIVTRYKSFYKARTTWLAVVPWAVFKKVVPAQPRQAKLV